MLEPPILVSSTDLLLQNLLPVPLNIFFKRTGSPMNTLNVTIQNIPEFVTISPGVRNGNVLSINEEITGYLTIMFAKEFQAKNFTLDISALQGNDQGQERSVTVFSNILFLTGSLFSMMDFKVLTKCTVTCFYLSANFINLLIL